MLEEHLLDSFPSEALKAARRRGAPDEVRKDGKVEQNTFASLPTPTGTPPLLPQKFQLSNSARSLDGLRCATKQHHRFRVVLLLQTKNDRKKNHLRGRKIVSDIVISSL